MPTPALYDGSVAQASSGASGQLSRIYPSLTSCPATAYLLCYWVLFASQRNERTELCSLSMLDWPDLDSPDASKSVIQKTQEQDKIHMHPNLWPQSFGWARQTEPKSLYTLNLSNLKTPRVWCKAPFYYDSRCLPRQFPDILIPNPLRVCHYIKLTLTPHCIMAQKIGAKEWLCGSGQWGGKKVFGPV